MPLVALWEAHRRRRDESVDRGAVAERTEAVEAPAPRGAVGEVRARAVQPQRDHTGAERCFAAALSSADPAEAKAAVKELQALRAWTERLLRRAR